MMRREIRILLALFMMLREILSRRLTGQEMYISIHLIKMADLLRLPMLRDIFLDMNMIRLAGLLSLRILTVHMKLLNMMKMVITL